MTPGRRPELDGGRRRRIRGRGRSATSTGSWRRALTLVEFSERAGITAVNLSVLKNDRARAIRFSTLVAVRRALDCGVGALLEIVPGRPAHPRSARR